MKLSKKDKIIIIGSMTILTLAILTPRLLLLNSTITCAKVHKLTKIKVNQHLIFEFYEEKEKKLLTNKPLKWFKIQDIDSLKKMDCIKIRYSNIWNSVTEVIDKRLVD
ncbi:MAG: hypothetical protein WC044_10705 [Crocinitomicaceae bacterium]